MTRIPDGRLAVDVVGEVAVEVEGYRLKVVGEGRLIRAEAPDWRTVSDLRGIPPARDARGRRGLHRLLKKLDVTLEFRVRGRPVARLGVGAKPGLMSWLFDVAPGELYFRQVFLAWRERHLPGQENESSPAPEVRSTE